MSKLTLDNRQVSDSFFEEARLLGIMAPIKDYQFCWRVNSLLRVDFRINHELEIPMQRKGRSYYFSVYEYNEPSTCLKHFLYKNKYDGEYLLPDLKHFDFLWLLKDDSIAEETLQQFVESLKQINGVQLVTELACDKIKHRENLVF